MLVTETGMLLLDEPFSALDEATRDFMIMELQRVSAEMQATAFLVTHPLAEAVVLSGRIFERKARPRGRGRCVRVALAAFV